MHYTPVTLRMSYRCVFEIADVLLVSIETIARVLAIVSASIMGEPVPDAFSFPWYTKTVGALDSQGRDVQGYTKIISKFPAEVQAGQSAYPA